jgi:ribonuclease G
LAQRTLRDLCSEHTQAVRVDGAACYQSLHTFAQHYMPAVLPKLSLHAGEHALFDLAQVDEQVNAALQRRVNLKSGAYLVIDQTESMCTIDVNTGSYVGSKNFADTVLNTNLEAASAIARQLRLRNLGGIILIDFIDMPSDEQREQVRLELARQLAQDPVRSHIHGFTALGLMELTRKRVRESLAHVLLQACECCAQTGQVKTAQTVAYDVLREIELQARQFDCKGFEVKVSQHVFDWFYADGNSMIQSLEASLKTSIHLVVHSLTAEDDYRVIVL